MPTTPVEAAVRDPASAANVPVEGIKGGASLSNPAGASSIRQVVAIGDGTDASTNFGAVDADQNLHVIVGRVSSATTSQVGTATSATSALASRAARVGVTMWNQSSSAMYIGFTSGVTAGPTGNATWTVGPGAMWTMPASYTGALYVIWDQNDSQQVNIADF